MTIHKKRSAGDKRYTVNDLCLHRGTSLAIEVIKTMPKPETKRELQKYKRDVAKVVGEELGETPTNALKNYILPQVFFPWEER